MVIATTSSDSATSTTTAEAKSPDKEGKPCRNLTQAFEALCVGTPHETEKEEKTDDVYAAATAATNSNEAAAAVANMISPTSVVQRSETPAR